MQRRETLGTRHGLLAAAGLLACSVAAAQAQRPNDGTPGQGPAVQASYPDPQAPLVQSPQPYPTAQAVPAGTPIQLSTLENRRRTPEPPPPPFVLSAEEMAELDRVLAAWEQRNKEVHSFECSFNEWVYDPTFADKTKPNDPIYTLQGRSSTPPRTRGSSRRKGRKKTPKSNGSATAGRSSSTTGRSARSRSIPCRRRPKAKPSPMGRCRSSSIPRRENSKSDISSV